MKNSIRSLLVILVLLATSGLFFTLEASAYEIDTHCYDTYAMARKAGFNHEYALFMCSGSQWVDEGLSSTPMGAAIWGSLVRRIWHFPNYRFQKQKITQDGKAGFAVITVAEFDHPVAYKLLDEGLREANWFKLALSIHVIEDTAGHAGFTAEAGHAEFGHNPDRTWLAVEKYKRMTGLVFKALLAMRQLAPDTALDSWAVAARKKPIEPNDYKKLVEDHWKDTETLVARNYFKDPRFTQPVVEYMLRLARTKGFLVKSFDVDANLPKLADYELSMPEQIIAAEKFKIVYKDGTRSFVDEYNRTRRDAREVLKNWVKTRREQEIAQGHFIKNSIFEMSVIDRFGLKRLRLKLEEIESSDLPLEEKIQAHNRLVSPEMTAHMIEQTVNFITQGEVPAEFNEYRHVQFESDDGPRSLEMALKIMDRRLHIARLYGRNFLFKADTFADRMKEKAQIKKEAAIQAMDPSVDLTLEHEDPPVLKQMDLEVVSLNKKQQIGILLIKQGYNFRTALRTIFDIFTKGKTAILAHDNVREFQIVDILNEKIQEGVYKQLGELQAMNLTGVSEACEAPLLGNLR